MTSSHAHTKAVASIVPREFRSVFPFTHFNHMQSVVSEEVFHSDENIVVAAPTGSGKTVLHELAICRVLQQRRHHPFRCVYIAPSKALCQQRWKEWFEKFSPLHQTVLELTGDVDIKDSLVSIAKASLIITTPEKWDSITRAWRDHVYLMSNIDLLLLDEIHHLGEDRGPTLEAVIVRMQYLASITNDNVPAQSYHRLRIVGISATLPNISDIGEWLHCTPRHIHYFDDTFRPVPLEIHTLNYGPAPNPFLFERSLDAKVYDVIRRFGNNRQSLVFCSSKNNTENVAEKLFRVRAGGGVLPSAVCQRIHQHGISDKKLLDFLQHGIAYHHAGLLPDDRSAVEDLFRLGHIRVLCSTSTLAHGINLPAYLVVVKGTFCWRGSIHGYEKLRRSDIVQMIGRAGRAGFDTTGVAVVMTNQEDLAQYSNLTSGLERVQSQLINNINEVINAEISQRVITSLNDCVAWLKTTFLYICMKKRVQSENNTVTTQDQQVTELASRTISTLENAHLITKDEEGRIIPYVECHIMAKTLTKLKSTTLLMNTSPQSGIKELIYTVSQCQEMHRPVRRDEKKFLNDCKQQLRFFFRERVQTPDKKSIVLLQAAIGRVPIKDFTLRVEQAELVENAIRLLKCLFELALSRSHGQLMESTVLLDRALKLRLWETANQNIFHQCKGISENTLTKISNLNKLSVFDFFGMNIHTVQTELSCTQEEARSLLQFSSDMIGAKLSMTMTQEYSDIVLRIIPAVPTNQRNISPVIKYQLLCFDSESKELLCYRSLPSGTLNQVIHFPNSKNISIDNIRCSLIGNVAGIDFSIGASRIEASSSIRSTDLGQEKQLTDHKKAIKRQQPANRSSAAKAKPIEITPIDSHYTHNSCIPLEKTSYTDSLNEEPPINNASGMQLTSTVITSPQNVSPISNKKFDFSQFSYQPNINPTNVSPFPIGEIKKMNNFDFSDVKENLSTNIAVKQEPLQSISTSQSQTNVPLMYKRKAEEFAIRGDIKRIKGPKFERHIREPFSSKTSATLSRGASSRFFDDSSISTENTLQTYQNKENIQEKCIEFPIFRDNKVISPAMTNKEPLVPQHVPDIQHTRSPSVLESMLNSTKHSSKNIDFDDAFL